MHATSRTDVKCCHSFIYSSGIYWLSTTCHILFISEKKKRSNQWVFFFFFLFFRASLMDQMVKSLRRPKFNPWVRKIPGEGNGNPFQYCRLENPMDRGALWAMSMGSQRVGHNWATNTHSHTLAHTMRFLLLFMFTFFTLQEMNKTQYKKKKGPPHWDLHSK